MRRAIVGWVASWLLLALGGAGGAAAVEAPCAPKLRAELDVSARGQPFVTLLINGGQAHLMLDTGAERTILTVAAAERLGLDPHFEHAQVMQGIGGNVAAGEVRPRSMTAGGMALPDVMLGIVPVNMPHVGDLAVDGLLGADLLVAFDLDLDIGHHRILLYEPVTCPRPVLPWPRRYVVIAAHPSKHRHMAFAVALDGHDLNAFIDTGAERSLVDTGFVAGLGVTEADLQQDQAAMMQGVSADVAVARLHRFGRLQLGELGLLSPSILVTPLRLDDADLLFGTDFLLHRRVWLSYASRRIFVAYGD
jgi:predicted aspartyl protease